MGEEIASPTYGDIASGLRKLQNELQVPFKQRLSLTAVFKDPFNDKLHFHALDRPIDQGLML